VCSSDLLAREPSNLDAQLGLYEAFLKLGLPEEAQAVFERMPTDGVLREQAKALKGSLEARPDPAALGRLADAYRRARLDALAAQTYEKAGAASSSEPRILKAYAEVLDRLGRRDEAIATYERALTAAPDDEELHLRLGAGLFFARRYPNAIDHYRKALEVNPHNAKTYFDLADVLHALKEYETEREVFSRLLDQNLSDKVNRQARLMLRRIPAKQ
jgi:tetratricopeptide (TPR) repeat protein